MLNLAMRAAAEINNSYYFEWNPGLWAGMAAIIIIQGLICGYISGKIADRGDMEFSIYFSLGLLFSVAGIIATLLVFFITGAYKEEEIEIPPDTMYYPRERPIGFENPLEKLKPPIPLMDQDIYLSNAVVCPICAMAVPIGRETCWNCGEFIPIIKPDRQCGTCYEVYPYDVDFCKSCGSRLDNLSAP